ncbi:hypothetical protein [Kribbella soli]|uniref:hypothetical protein n=1 Tax=Kribbella soli TaxID=1124743 RepID=UPI0013F3BF4A|nr:hypothetical protein [Kribbella soli]
MTGTADQLGVPVEVLFDGLVATAPGDNGRIAYSAEAGAGVQLFTVRQDGSGRIVFDSEDGIAIMRTDGTGRRQLTVNPFPGAGYDTDANVSPTAGTSRSSESGSARSNRRCSGCASTGRVCGS